MEISQFPRLSSLTAKIPWTAIGIIAAIVLLVGYLGSVNWSEISQGGVSVPKSGKGTDGWKTEGEVVVKNNQWEISPGGKISKTIYASGASVGLYDVSSPSSSSLAIKIECRKDNRRSATFNFLVEGKSVRFNKAKMDTECFTPEFKEDLPIHGWSDNYKYFSFCRAVIGGDKFSYALGNSEITRSYIAEFPPAIQRNEKLEYKVSVKNTGSSLIIIKGTKTG